MNYGLSDGTFAPAVALGIPSYYPAVLGLADLNGDHKPRVLVFSSEGVGVGFGNTPDGAALYSATGAFFAQALLADYNGDGLADVAVPGDKSIVFLYGKPDGTFEAAKSIETDVYIGGLTAFDATGDRIPDIILSSDRVFPGNGDGTFGTSIGQGADDPQLIYAGDFDGNGHLGFYTYESINRNNEDGTFTTQYLDGIPFSAPFPTNFAVIADYNNDGLADIALSTSLGGPYDPSSDGNAVTIATSGPNQTFTYSTLTFPEPIGPLGAGDFNGDGCNDLALGAATQIEIYLGDCTGNFTAGPAYLTNTGATVTGLVGGFGTSLEPSDMVVADFDGDGTLDIVYTVPGLSLAKILYGHGDGTFDAGNDITLDHSSIYVTTADLNSDGNPDLIFSGQSLVTVLYGQKSRSFSTPSILAAGFVTGKAVVSDLNLDGNPDIVVSNLDYDGGDDSNDSGFTFAVFLNNSKARTTDSLDVKLTVSPEPSSYGQPFTATATFTPVSNPNLPTGTATFTLDGASPTPGKLSTSGVATATFPIAAVGTHKVAVSYPGDANFASASASVKHIVIGYESTTTLTCSATPIYVDATTLLSAMVTSSNGTPTGSITFTDAATTLGQIPLTNGDASLNFTAQSAGTQTITATYVPTGDFAASSATCNLTVLALPTTSVLAVTPTTSTFGSPVTLTATVSPVTKPGPSVPTGTVTFYNGATSLNTATLSAGVATYTTSTLPGGPNNLTCAYSGSSIYAPSNCNTISTTIAAAPTLLTLTSSANPSPALTPITFTAQLTVSGQPAPAGNTLTLTLNGQTITLTTDATGSAAYITPGLIPNAYPVTAAFAATADLQASSASLLEQVNPNPTTTTLTASPTPGQQGQPVTLSATVTATVGAAAPNGSVQFFDGATLLGTIAVAPATGTTSTATFSATSLAVGSHSLSAAYVPGSTSFLPSQSTLLPYTVLLEQFTITAAQNPFYIVTTQTRSDVLTLTSLGGFTAAITVSCPPTLPPAATCALSSSTVQLPANGTATTTLTITTEVTTGATFWTRLDRGRSNASRIALASILPFSLLALAGLRRRRCRTLLTLALLAVLASTLTACGPGQTVSTFPGTYPLTFTAAGTAQGSSTPTTHTLNLTLVVTPDTQ